MPRNDGPATGSWTQVRWWRRRRWQALTVAVALTAAAGGVLAANRGSGEELPRTSPRTVYGLYDAKPGSTFAMGNLRIFEPGKTVQILSAKALTSANVEYLGAYTVWPSDYVPPPAVDEEFPAVDQKVRHELTEIVPVSETARFEPGWPTSVPITVTLGFRIRSGMGAVNGIHLTYKVNGKTKRQYFAEAAYGCVLPLKCAGDRSLDDDDKALRELDLVRSD